MTAEFDAELERAEQETFDVEFTWIVESERTLDDVLVRLAEVGVTVEPWQRAIVAEWVVSQVADVPLASRLAVLREMLSVTKTTRTDDDPHVHVDIAPTTNRTGSEGS